ncbi:hypothetical protein N9A59_01325, partial [Gammaproteobacteria bacterium]|nr:hypothetical protein [Gammaproteobacteria bacterium]
MFKLLSRNAFIVLAVSFSFSSIDLSAQNAKSDGGKSGKTRSYKKARVLMSSTAKQVQKVVEALERQKTIKVPDPLNEGQFIEKDE